MTLRRILFVLALLITSAGVLPAEAGTGRLPSTALGPGKPAPTYAATQDKVRVFLDCDQCDFDYLRREIQFVDYVRERKEADVHILVTTQGTGSGGQEYVFTFVGLGRFADVNDSLKFSSSQASTDEERRAGYSRILKLGLVRYASSTPMAARLDLEFKDEDEVDRPATGQKDPWNFWVFRVRADTSFEGEESQQQREFSGSFTGNRVTEAWKVNTSLNLNFQEEQFTLSNGDELVDKSHAHRAGALIVKSLTEHWSAAVRGEFSSRTFLNQDRALSAGAGIEYSFFPYRASATKELTAQLTLGVNHFDYTEPTIYDKEKETVTGALFVASFDVTQRWGTADVTFETLTYFHDPGRHRMELEGDTEIRLFKGFSLSVQGSISRIRDQLYLRKGDATDEEILLRRRQLATDYRYRFSMGFSYTFGSIFNNIVNTRF